MSESERTLALVAGVLALVWLASRTRAGGELIATSSEYAGETAREVIELAQTAIGALTRGERNNNPGNVERTADRWQGMASDQSGDARFVVFDSPIYGVRALARVLLNYGRRGLTNLTQIVSTWAPPSDNNTAAYISAVADELGVPANQALDLGDPRNLALLATAIVRHENGRVIYPPELIAQGVQLAYV